ncbi:MULTISPECIES: GNAT family N-acetyltransferase [unclassified Jeotgalibaca]|uniref:GNAT family N-acetyltransferase n=1 Tax=unclassified Jeotgalibaca TaxID=2621505 RepID=UPI003FD49C8C
MNESITIRPATAEDAKDLLGIYAPYVLQTAITFEYEVPTVEEFSNRITHTLQKYPYIVAVENNEIIGYAYASPYGTRKAFDWSAEVSIYLDSNQRGKGLGGKLYTALEEMLYKQNIINVYACIAETDEESDYLNHASQRFHTKRGYKKVAHFKKAGHKFKEWFDIIWMEKQLRDHPDEAQSIIPFSKL